MKDLLKFILESLTGNSDFDIEEASEGDGFMRLTAHIKKEDMGLVIGREGATIKTIRNLLRIKAILEKKAFTLNVIEKGV
jgi:predicted RNA-binding protein YlqC (UPF0109 family)